MAETAYRTGRQQPGQSASFGASTGTALKINDQLKCTGHDTV
ncbi:hypothetical protein [Ferruginibacter sp.]|nr:hypothetical protein [Ferruginibacter sp.]